MWIIKRKTNKSAFSNDLPCQKKITKWLPAKVTKRSLLLVYTSHSFIINKFYWQFICIMCLHNARNWFASQRKHCAIESWWPNHITDTKDHYLCGETFPIHLKFNSTKIKSERMILQFAFSWRQHRRTDTDTAFVALSLSNYSDFISSRA